MPGSIPPPPPLLPFSISGQPPVITQVQIQKQIQVQTKEAKEKELELKELIKKNLAAKNNISVKELKSQNVNTSSKAVTTLIKGFIFTKIDSSNLSNKEDLIKYIQKTQDEIKGIINIPCILASEEAILKISNMLLKFAKIISNFETFITNNDSEAIKNNNQLQINGILEFFKEIDINLIQKSILLKNDLIKNESSLELINKLSYILLLNELILEENINFIKECEKLNNFLQFNKLIEEYSKQKVEIKTTIKDLIKDLIVEISNLILENNITQLEKKYQDLIQEIIDQINSLVIELDKQDTFFSLSLIIKGSIKLSNELISATEKEEKEKKLITQITDLIKKIPTILTAGEEKIINNLNSIESFTFFNTSYVEELNKNKLILKRKTTDKKLEPYKNEFEQYITEAITSSNINLTQYAKEIKKDKDHAEQILKDKIKNDKYEEELKAKQQEKEGINKGDKDSSSITPKVDISSKANTTIYPISQEINSATTNTIQANNESLKEINEIKAMLTAINSAFIKKTYTKDASFQITETKDAACQTELDYNQIKLSIISAFSFAKKIYQEVKGIINTIKSFKEISSANYYKYFQYNWVADMCKNYFTSVTNVYKKYFTKIQEINKILTENNIHEIEKVAKGLVEFTIEQNYHNDSFKTIVDNFYTTDCKANFNYNNCDKNLNQSEYVFNKASSLIGLVGEVEAVEIML